MERLRIPLKAEGVDDCSKCNPSACCMGRLVLQLNDPEAELMRTTGNRLFMHVAPEPFARVDAPYPVGMVLINGVAEFDVDPNNPNEPLPAHHGRYIMPDRCKNLVSDLLGRTSCAIYEDRPQACSDFQPGSRKCHDMQKRLKLGV